MTTSHIGDRINAAIRLNTTTLAFGLPLVHVHTTIAVMRYKRIGTLEEQTTTIFRKITRNVKR
jgi:type III secretory pathway component EscS